MPIGIGHALLQFRNNHFDNLKQYAMIFDEIHIVNLKSLEETTKKLLEDHNLSHLQERDDIRRAIGGKTYLRINCII